MPGDFCIHQLTSVIHKKYASFDSNTWFLDVFKAFDQLLHEGLICKITCMGINGIFDQIFCIRKTKKSCS